MSQNNTPRQRPTDLSWLTRIQPLLLIIVVLGLVAGAFAAGRRTSGDALPSATPTAEQEFGGQRHHSTYNHARPNLHSPT